MEYRFLDSKSEHITRSVVFFVFELSLSLDPQGNTKLFN